MSKKIIYVDMDGVLVDFESALKDVNPGMLKQYEGQYDNIPRIFSMMKPMPNAVESYKKLSNDPRYDVYIASSGPWDNPSSFTDKIVWVQKYIEPEVPGVRKRVILTSQKHLNNGSYIIDDRLKNGVSEFQGHHIHFGSEEFPDWNSVLEFFKI